MKASTKDLGVAIDIKNSGVELEVGGNNNEHLGDLVVTKAHVTWCKGRTTRANGKKLTRIKLWWNGLFQLMGDVFALRAIRHPLAVLGVISGVQSS